MINGQVNTPDVDQLRMLVERFRQEGRYDKLLEAISVPVLQRLNLLAAEATLSRLVISEDYRFMLTDYQKEVDMSPIHKSLYILFLNHPEGIEFKRLIDHREELLSLYRKMSNRVSEAKLTDTIDRIVNPLDNAVHEKCARIKAAFALCMDQYQLSYYAISSHTERHIDGSSRIWFERKKTIKLPRELVDYQYIL